MKKIIAILLALALLLSFSACAKNEEEKEHDVLFRQMCRWLVTNGFARCPLHLTRFFPAYRLKMLPPTPINTLRAAQKIAREEGMMHVLLGNV